MSNQTFQASDDGVNWYIGLFEGTPVPRYITINHGTRYRLVDPASVVVLDPDHPDDVERLADALRAKSIGALPSSTEAALRSLLPAATPPEPNGLGAVVEWHGQRWIRAYLKHDLPWLNGSVTPSRARWNEFGKVVVLSHGWRCSCAAPDCPGEAS